MKFHSMTKKTINNLCFVICFLLISCTQPNHIHTILSVEVPSKGELYLMTLDSLGFTVSQQLNFEGVNFKTVSLDLEFPAEVRLESTLIQNQLRLRVTPGDSLAVAIVLDSLPNHYSFRITGSDSTFQNYLLKKDLEFSRFVLESWQTQPENELVELDRMRSEWSRQRNSASFESHLIRYDSLADWSRQLNFKLGKFMATPALDTSEIASLFHELSVYNPGLKKVFDFNRLVFDLQYLFVTLSLLENDRLAEYYQGELLTTTIQTLSVPSLDPYILLWMKAIMISEISDYGIDGDLGKEYQKYISSPDSPPVFIEALKQRAQIWLRLRAGNPAPDFEAITTAGDTVRLSDYFGKYLFLDVWASWCKPCIAEFPHSLVMMLDSRFKDFEFIFVNLDRNQELWKQGMKQFNIPDGTHLFMPDDFDGEIFVQYNRTSIPRYILIDPQGKIINARAPRPSQRDKIFETISDLAL